MLSLPFAKAEHIESIRDPIDTLGFQPLQRYTPPTPCPAGLPVVRMARDITDAMEYAR